MKLLAGALSILLSFSAFSNEVKDSGTVPVEIDLRASISSQSTCGLINIDTVDFASVEAGLASVDYEVSVDVTVNCSNFLLWYIHSTGSGYYDIGSGAGIVVAKDSGGIHMSFTDLNWLAENGTGADQVVTIYVRPVNTSDTSVTPSSVVNWSGSVPIELHTGS